MVLHITNIPAPFRFAFYRAVRDGLRELGEDFHVLFLGKGGRRRLWQVSEADLEGIDHSFAGHSPTRTAIAAIRRHAPSVVVLSWAMDHRALALLLYCRGRGIPCLVVTGETEASVRALTMRPLREIFRRPFYLLGNGFVTYGTRSTEYLRNRGVAPRRIRTAINVSDTVYFRERVEEMRRSGEAERGREGHRMPDGRPFACHLLFVGYLLQRKGMLPTLEALVRLGRPDVALHIVGAGEQEGELRARVASGGLEGSVFFHGYRQRDELPYYFALADVLLFPSVEEVFGLVMVEGAAAGLPVIASSLAGGTVDVVADGVSGIVIDPRDTAEYAAAIARLADDPELCARMGAAGRERTLEILTPERSAAGYIDAVARVRRD